MRRVLTGGMLAVLVLFFISMFRRSVIPMKI